MSGEIVNLRRFRKAKSRAGKDEQAAENRRRHGLTKTEREVEQAQRTQADRHIEGHRREPDDT